MGVVKVRLIIPTLPFKSRLMRCWWSGPFGSHEWLNRYGPLKCGSTGVRNLSVSLHQWLRICLLLLLAQSCLFQGKLDPLHLQLPPIAWYDSLEKFLSKSPGQHGFWIGSTEHSNLLYCSVSVTLDHYMYSLSLSVLLYFVKVCKIFPTVILRLSLISLACICRNNWSRL